MPIRINLLAEEQAAEELRRKDPLKRAIIIAGVVVAVVVVFAGFNTMRVKASTAEANGIRQAYEDVKDKELALKEMRAMTGRLEANLDSLHRLATNRFLVAPVINELQFSMVDGIRLTRFVIKQNFEEYAAVPPPPDTDEQGIPAKSIEHVAFEIYADDRAGKYNEYMAKIAERFEGRLRKRDGVKLQNLSDPIESADGSGSYRAVVIECRYPSVTREP